MEEEKLYNTELKKVLALISKDILDDYPQKSITVDYFMLGILQSKQSTAYKMLTKLIRRGEVQQLYDYYLDRLNTLSATTVKPKVLNNNPKSIGYDSVFTNALVNSKIEKEKLNDQKIGSEHVLLSILLNEDSVYKQWCDIGLNYSNLFNVINAIKQEDLKKYDKEDPNSYVNSLVNPLEGIKNKPIKKSMVEAYCVNLNKLAKMGKIDQLIGRETEINRLIKILGRRNKSNVVLVGPGGVGLSSIVSGIANLIEEGKGMFLNGKEILSLDVTSMVSGSNYRGQLEERMNGVITEVKANPNYILFIDDIHISLGSNSTDSANIAGMLSNSMSDSNIQIIATTSFKGYKNTIENNSTLSRRFQKIIIDPTTVEETEKILFNSKKYYEEYHNVKYTDEAIKACVNLANKYITERHLPDSAIDIMDECGSEKKVSNHEGYDETSELKKELELNNLLVKKKYAADDFEEGDKYNAICQELKAKIVDIEKTKKSKAKKNIKEVSETDVYNMVSEITGVPISKLSTSEKQRYLNIESKLSESIIGQAEAIKAVAQSMKRSRMGLNGAKVKPSSFIFIGESGCGKTMLAKKLAEEVFGSEESLVRFDMSEYSDKTSVNKLLGSSAGYVGYEQGGLLTEAIKQKPYCVLLLDEIEKADKEVYNVFLQIFDNGSANDNTGQKISFKNVIIIMTSNVGAKDAASFSKGAGFTSNVEENKKNITEKALKSQFPPEFINRIDSIIYFNHLADDNLKSIISLELNNFKKRLKEINFNIEYDENVVDYIFKSIVNDKNTGARKINRAIQNEIENEICDLYLENEYEKDYVFKVNVNEGKIEIK